MNYDQMSRLCDTVLDSFSPESYAENMTFIDQSFQAPQLEIKLPNYQENSSSIDKCSPAPDPLVATTLPSSTTFTISFGDLKPKSEILQFPDPLPGAIKVPTVLRNPLQAQDHVLAERKRREKLNRHFISLSAIIPNLTKVLIYLKTIFFIRHNERGYLSFQSSCIYPITH